MTINNRTITAIMAAVLALSLLLTACGNGGDTPTGDNTTPGVTDTQTPSGAESPDNTPSGENTNTPDTSEPTGEPEPTPGETTDPTTKPTRPDVSLEYDDEKKVKADEQFVQLQDMCDRRNIDIDLDDAINGAFDDYWEFFDERITYEAVRTALVVSFNDITKGNFDKDNISKIKSGSFEKANDFIISKGGNALDIKDPKQNIAAWVIASSLFYQENCDDLNDPIWDLGCSLGFGLNDGEPSLFEVMFKENYYVIVE